MSAFSLNNIIKLLLLYTTLINGYTQHDVGENMLKINEILNKMNLLELQRIDYILIIEYAVMILDIDEIRKNIESNDTILIDELEHTPTDYDKIIKIYNNMDFIDQMAYLSLTQNDILIKIHKDFGILDWNDLYIASERIIDNLYFNCGMCK